jgi:hypothetical protein
VNPVGNLESQVNVKEFSQKVELNIKEAESRKGCFLLTVGVFGLFACLLLDFLQLWLAVVGIKPRILGMPSKHTTTELTSPVQKRYF